MEFVRSCGYSAVGVSQKHAVLGWGCSGGGRAEPDLRLSFRLSKQ